MKSYLYKTKRRNMLSVLNVTLVVVYQVINPSTSSPSSGWIIMHNYKMYGNFFFHALFSYISEETTAKRLTTKCPYDKKSVRPDVIGRENHSKMSSFRNIPEAKILRVTWFYLFQKSLL